MFELHCVRCSHMCGSPCSQSPVTSELDPHQCTSVATCSLTLPPFRGIQDRVHLVTHVKLKNSVRKFPRHGVCNQTRPAHRTLQQEGYHPKTRSLLASKTITTRPLVRKSASWRSVSTLRTWISGRPSSEGLTLAQKWCHFTK